MFPFASQFFVVTKYFPSANAQGNKKNPEITNCTCNPLFAGWIEQEVNKFYPNQRDHEYAREENRRISLAWPDTIVSW